MLCPFCKSPVPDDGRFCPNCGREANTQQFSFGDQQTLGSREDSVGMGETLSREESLGEQPTLADGDGQTIGLTGRYEIIEELGRGGMGVVYKAKDKGLGRIVAIKRLLSRGKSAERAIERFLREARSIALLNHPNVVHIYDIGEDEEGKFISMEYVDGGSLKDKISSGVRLEVSIALDIIRQVSNALSHAHKKGLIHRDIKPGNILLTQEGMAKLGDFGLAMGIDETSFTRTGAILGTPDYMSPEQRTDAKSVNERTDVYSLGATLYELVTGESPRIINSEKIPDALREPLLRSLEPSPEKRYAGVEEFVSSLPPPDEVIAPVKRLERGCPQCGKESPVDVKFCIHCGADLSSLFEKCPKCGREGIVGTRHCGSCGLNIQQFKEIQSHLSKAKECYSNFNYAQALKEFNKVLELDPSHVETSRVVDGQKVIYHEWEDNEVVKLHQEVNGKLQALNRHKSQAQTYFDEEKYEDATREVKEALELTPKDDSLLSMLKRITSLIKERDIKVHLKKAEDAVSGQDFEVAKAESMKVLELDDNNTQAKQIHERSEAKIKERDIKVHLKRAEDAVSGQDFEVAKAESMKVLELDGNNTQARKIYERSEEISELISKAKTPFTKGDYARTISICREILQISPMLSEAEELLKDARANLREIAQLKESAQGHFKRKEYHAAISDWHAILALIPGDQAILAEIAKAHSEIRNIRAARARKRAWRRAIIGAGLASIVLIAGIALKSSISQKRYLTYFASAQVLQREGNYNEALSNYRKSLEYRPGSKKALSAIDSLKEEALNAAIAAAGKNNLSKAVALRRLVLTGFPAEAENKKMKELNKLISGFYIADGMVLIPAGEFLMGSNDGDSNERPVHKVYVDAFYMDKYEVTVGQYNKFIKVTGYRKPENWSEQLQNPRRPVIYVSWNDAVAYAKWTGKRLPMEAEWEKAARGGLVGKEFPWGNSIDKTKANYDSGGTKPVGSYPPNGYGLYDTAGNVSEWVADRYGKDYYKSGPYKNPRGPTSGKYRVLRGGSWDNNAGSIRAANRYGNSPGGRDYYGGFRCAGTP